METLAHSAAALARRLPAPAVAAVTDDHALLEILTLEGALHARSGLAAHHPA